MRVAVAVPCTDRKRGGAASLPARFRSVDASFPIEGRAERWASKLVAERASGEVLPLRDLYVGPGWTASIDLVGTLHERLEGSTDALVVSAGLGLQSLNPLLPGWPRYSATFATGHPDSIAGPTEDPSRAARKWWSLLSAQDQLGGGSFRGLAGTHDAVLVVASTPYLRAVADDLVAAAAAGLRVVAYTSSKLRLDALERFLVRFDARARRVAPASDARATADFVAYVARRIGADSLDVAAAQRFVERVLADHTAPSRPRGEPASSDEVREFIAEALTSDPAARKGPLLRRWRDAGRAFEQRRFGELYEEVRSSLAAASGAGPGGGRP